MRGFWYDEPFGKNKRTVGFTCPCCGEHIGPRIGEVIQLGRVKVDTSTREVWLDGQYFDPKPGSGKRRFGASRGKELTILIEMMLAPGQPFSVERLMDLTDSWDASADNIRVYICRLRQSFGAYLEFRNYRASPGEYGLTGAYSLHVRDETVA